MKQKNSGQRNISILNLLSGPTEVAEALNSQYTAQFTRDIHVNPPWSSGRLSEMSPKISSKTYHFLQKGQNLPHLN